VLTCGCAWAIPSRLCVPAKPGPSGPPGHASVPRLPTRDSEGAGVNSVPEDNPGDLLGLYGNFSLSGGWICAFFTGLRPVASGGSTEPPPTGAHRRPGPTADRGPPPTGAHRRPGPTADRGPPPTVPGRVPAVATRCGWPLAPGRADGPATWTRRRPPSPAAHRHRTRWRCEPGRVIEPKHDALRSVGLHSHEANLDCGCFTGQAEGAARRRPPRCAKRRWTVLESRIMTAGRGCRTGCF
jgi:hypothetical protein